MSRDESCRVHYRAEDVLMSRQDIKLLMDEVSSLKSQVSSLTCQNLGRFLRFRLEPCYLRLQVAGFFSNLLEAPDAWPHVAAAPSPHPAPAPTVLMTCFSFRLLLLVLMALLSAAPNAQAQIPETPDEGPDPDPGRKCIAKIRRTTSLSISTPKASVICSAIRGQPQLGLRRFVSTTASMSSLVGPLGPGRRLSLGENRRRYFRLMSM